MVTLTGPVRAMVFAAASALVMLVALTPHSAIASSANQHLPAISPEADASALTCNQAKRRTRVASRRLKLARRAFGKARRSGKAAKRKAAKRLARAKTAYRRAKKRQAAACKRSSQPAAPSVNHPPEIRNPLVHYDFDARGEQQGCNLVYGGFEGIYCSTLAVFIDLHPAIDPDGDPLSYAWAVSTGEIKANPPGGLHAEWYRPIQTFEIFGSLLQEFVDVGTVYITVSDGKGGVAHTELPPKELVFEFPTGGV